MEDGGEAVQDLVEIEGARSHVGDFEQEIEEVLAFFKAGTGHSVSS